MELHCHYFENYFNKAIDFLMQQQKKLIADTFRQKKIVLADLSTFALHFLKAIHIHVKG